MIYFLPVQLFLVFAKFLLEMHFFLIGYGLLFGLLIKTYILNNLIKILFVLIYYFWLIWELLIILCSLALPKEALHHVILLQYLWKITALHPPLCPWRQLMKPNLWFPYLIVALEWVGLKDYFFAVYIGDRNLFIWGQSILLFFSFCFLVFLLLGINSVLYEHVPGHKIADVKIILSSLLDCVHNQQVIIPTIRPQNCGREWKKPCPEDIKVIQVINIL